MKHILFSLLFLASAFVSVNAQSVGDFFAATDDFLSSHVANGKVDYKTIAASPETLDKLVAQIESADLSASEFNEQLAFYLNAYNILVIKNVVDNSPLSSPLDVKGFFDVTTFGVAGERLTLNQIENEIVRPTFKDPRIHFALVCGANGCPPITSVAYTARNVEARLGAATSSAINDPAFIKVDFEQGVVYASEIFKWYIVDFGNSAEGVLGFINQYSNNDLAGFGLDYYAYDWQLNQK